MTKGGLRVVISLQMKRCRFFTGFPLSATSKEADMAALAGHSCMNLRTWAGTRTRVGSKCIQDSRNTLSFARRERSTKARYLSIWISEESIPILYLEEMNNRGDLGAHFNRNFLGWGVSNSAALYPFPGCIPAGLGKNLAHRPLSCACGARVIPRDLKRRLLPATSRRPRAARRLCARSSSWADTDRLLRAPRRYRVRRAGRPLLRISAFHMRPANGGYRRFLRLRCCEIKVRKPPILPRCFP